MIANIVIDRYALLAIVLVFSGVMGLRHGINRELVLMLGIILAIVLSDGIAVVVQPMVNRFYKLGLLALSGGMTSDDPAAAWKAIRDHPDLIRTDADAQWLVAAVFAGIVLLFFMWSRWRLPSPKGIMSPLLGMIAGGINGFLASFRLFPLIFSHPNPTTVITFPSRALNETLVSGTTLAWVGVFFAGVLIAFGLYSASGPRRR